MYVIIIYDVSSKKDTKVLKLLRKYLFHVQKSVFEGNLTPAKYKELKEELDTIPIHKDEQILIYQLFSEKELRKEVIGKETKTQVIIT